VEEAAVIPEKIPGGTAIYVYRLPLPSGITVLQQDQQYEIRIRALFFNEKNFPFLLQTNQ
jgi:hypothetical protein